jgi:thiamine biosynthesis lipoprotein
MEHKGKRYSHIIDPETGYGVTFQRNVTVIADDGADADWLASACSILSIKKAKKVAKRNGAALLITAMHKGKIKFYRTENFDSFWGR